MQLCAIILLAILFLLVLIFYQSRIEAFRCISRVNVGDVLRDCDEPLLTLCDSATL